MAPSDWQDILLEDVANEITVGHVGPMASEYKEEGIPFLRSQNVEPFRIIEQGIKFISPEFHARLSKSELHPGDVVIVRTGKPGACAVIPDSLSVANCSDLVIVRCGPKLVPRFLTYYVNSAATHHVDSHLVGAVQQHFNVGSARKLRMLLPNISEQRAISHILGTLDDKHDLLRRMNETLEAIARALFKSWFVDFDPVRAKAEGRKPLGMDSATAALFPAEFADSEFGEVPKGWEVVTIGDLADIVGGSTPSTKEPKYWIGGIHHWATPKDLSGLTVPILMETERKVTEAGLAQIGSGLLPVGTVLLSSRAPIGYLAVAEVPVAINQGFIAMVPKSGISTLFLLLWTFFAHEDILSRANGSTFQEISKTNFRPIPLVAPPPGVMRTFDETVRALYGRIVENEHESRTLASIRDALLPKLITGELRLNDVERFIERAM